MDSWKDQILREFAPDVARLTLVADPDGLLLETDILDEVRKRGYELISFEDQVSFRYFYESKFRSLWDAGQSTDLSVILRYEGQDPGNLPYDLLQAGRKLAFSLGDLFPNLSYPVIAELDRSHLGALYDAQQQQNADVLGVNVTKDFILRHVFGVDPELIKQPHDLLLMLLSRHYGNQRVPITLDERLIQVLQSKEVFRDWPLREILPDRNSFFSFLQERWLPFLDGLADPKIKVVREAACAYALEYAGPLDVPFEHDNVRIYVDNLFLEGLLKPVSHERANELPKTWISIGVEADPVENHRRRLKGFMKKLEEEMPQNDARHQDWSAFAFRWAELMLLMSEPMTGASPNMLEEFQNLQQLVDNSFRTWCEKNYAGLYNQPPVPPVMVHHIPKALARQMSELRQSKIALIVVDGLSIDQWLVLRDVLSKQIPELRLRESAVYAWIPTITSVSRQALFSGRMPFYFSKSIYITDREPNLWLQFWLDQELSQLEVVYIKGLGDDDVSKVHEMLSDPRTRIAGLIVDKVDKIMHGIELGTAGMHNQIRQWAMQGYLAGLIDLLRNLGFGIWLTSDHGNIQALGCGRPSEGAIAETRGERVRIYSSEILRDSVKQKFPDAMEWPLHGLPDNFLPLLASGRSAFIKEGKQIVGHGGISLEEVIIPLVEIGWKNT